MSIQNRSHQERLHAACLPGLLCVLLCFASSLPAQEKPAPKGPPKPLDIDVQRQYSVRSEGPISLRVTMTPSSSTMLEGRLEFKLWNGRDLLSTLVTDDEVINPPSKTVRYTLPSPDLRGYSPTIDLTVDFVSKNGRLKYGPFPILVPLSNDRHLVIAQVAPETMRPSGAVEGLLNALKLEKYSPLQRDKTITTMVWRFVPDQLPPDALQYCNFNMLFVAAEGFAAVKESQWPAMLQWIEAGGSACFLPAADLSPHHVAFLNKLVSSGSPQGTFVLSRNNDLLLAKEDQRKPVYLARRGLGQIAIVPLLTDEVVAPDSKEWRQTVARLWKFRHDQAASLEATGRWNDAITEEQLQALRASGHNYYYSNVRGEDHKLSHIPMNSGDQLIQGIVPSNLHIIPLSLIAFVLFLYVLAIGPGDYFILGRFNLRKWTWVTFPVTTLLFAGGALWMAEWYMNTGDARRSAYIVDIGAEGKPNRVNQFEMLFNSRQKVTETTLSRSLFTSLDHQMYGSGSYQQFNQRQFGQGGGFVGPAEIQGRIPTKFTARQLTPKWVPQLNRMMTFDTDKFVVKLDWQRFKIKDVPEWTSLLNDNTWKRSLIDPIKQAMGSRPLIIGIYTGGKYNQIYGVQRMFTREEVRTDNGNTVVVQQPQQFNRGLQVQLDFMSDICQLQDGGIFSIVSSMSPHGGRQLEDLCMVDSSDPAQWLLVVGVEDGQDWIVYRKLYSGTE